MAMCYSAIASQRAHAADNTIEELIITGKRPGPKLWKVHNGDNILWVMGIAEPLPKSLDWDDASIKLVMEQSHAFLTPPTINVSVNNPLKAVGLFRQYKKLQKLPKGTTLNDTLSLSRQQSYKKIIDQYGIKTNKKLRPLFVAKQLHEKALKRVGLEDAERLHKKLFKLAKTNKVDIIHASSEMDVNEALKMLKNVDQQAELKCFDATLKRLDKSVERSIRTAQAWADGDHQALTEIALNNNDNSCTDALINSAQALAAVEASKALWLEQAQTVLLKNKVSFAYLPIIDIVSPDGLISSLNRNLNATN